MTSPPPGRRRRRIRRALPPPGLALALALLALPLAGAAARHAGPAPFGDRLTPRPATAGAPGPAAAPVLGTVPDPVPRLHGDAVEGRPPAGGPPVWTYRRDGRRPLVVRSHPGHALTLWDDGLVTDTAPADGTVRWHRAVPGLPADPAGVLQPLDPAARMIAVVTPARIAAFRTADGDLRWIATAPPGCAHDPARQARLGAVLLIARPCTGPDASWTDGVIAVDSLGRVGPHRRPLGNERPGEATHSPGK